MNHDRPLRKAALAILPVFAAMASGQIATLPNLAPWYRHLAKPSFNPPDWLFGPAWTLLYALMAYAAWRILHVRAITARRHALFLFYLQLALNALWSWLFFAAHDPLAGLIEIVLYWLAILATIDGFRRLDRIAAACLVPLALWVAYAALLNGAIWRLNG